MRVFSALVTIFALISLFWQIGAQAMSLQDRIAAWNAHSNFSSTEIVQLDSVTDFRIAIPLTIVVLKNSQWSQAEVIEKIRSTELIYAQCEISFRPIAIVKTVHGQGPVPDANNAASYVDIRDLVDSGAATKPIVFMTDAEKFGRHNGGSAWRTGSVGPNSPKTNTVLLYRSGALENSGNFYSFASHPLGYYEVMAHELAHLLFDQSHTNSPGHLMSNMKKRTNIIRSQDCAVVRNFVQ